MHKEYCKGCKSQYVNQLDSFYVDSRKNEEQDRCL